ncbi:MAG: collagen-binding domain-containing protein [Haloplanus sp.]
MTDPSARAQSNVIGVVLLLGIVVVGTTSVVILGGAALSDVDRHVDVQRGELAMTNLDSRVSDVALGSAESRRVELGGSGTARVDGTAGTVTIEQIGCGGCPQTMANTSLGAVAYTRGPTTIAYQGGGVWRTDGGRARMVSPPEFHYRWGTTGAGEPTLTFPLVVLRGHASSDALVFRKNGTRAVFPDPSRGRTNPLDAGSVRITIQSDYYRGWATYFETRTDADTVTVDDANRTVVAVLSVPGKSREVTDSIAARSPTVTVQGGATVDSYNSSQGGYPATRGENGSVYVGEDLANAGGGTIYGDMRVDGDFGGGGGVDVKGDLIADGDVTLGGGVDVDGSVLADGDLAISGGTQVNSPVIVSGRVVETGGGVRVTDDVVAGGDYVAKSSTIDGDVRAGGDFTMGAGTNVNGDVTVSGTFVKQPWQHPSGTVTEHAPPPDLSGVDPARDLTPPNLQPIDHSIDSRVQSYSMSNDNAGSDAARIETDECGGGHPACTLSNGTYHLSSLELTGGQLTFDATGGPVYVAVDGDVSTTGGTSVDVVGSHTVHVYATGDYDVAGGSTWESVGDRGDQIWLYGSSSSSVSLSGGSTVYGVVYAPGNRDISVTGGAELYGALVGQVSTVDGGTAVHYDTVLSDQKPELAAGAGAPITYLHVTVNEVDVEDG